MISFYLLLWYCEGDFEALTGDFSLTGGEESLVTINIDKYNE